jgi:hypothetical protein
MGKHINNNTHAYREKSVWSREGIGLELPEIRYRADCKLGSQILREACLDLFQRTANRYLISMSDAMACHLGYHSPPKLIRSAYKTSSARKLAA